MTLRLFGNGKPEPADRIVRIDGLDEFRKELRKLGALDGLEALKATNKRIAEMVVEKTKPRMAKASHQSASTLAASNTARGAYVRGGGPRAPQFGGVEFGAYQNMRRLIKNPYKGQGRKARRSRATIVRSGENIDKIRKRVESNFVTSTGKTVSAREGGMQVRVKQVRLGWNQFEKWTGNGPSAGYFLYATVRAESQEIMDLYRKAMVDIAHDAFPKGD